jgi:uncharacterized cupredoxin-like copper-binding protein
MSRTFKIFSQVLSIWIFTICFLVISPNLVIAASINETVKLAAVDFTKQTAIEVKVSLSNNANELKFFPERFTFESGKRYKLLLSNTSGMKHYFTSKDFADAIWTQNVVAGNVEVKGNIRELQLLHGLLSRLSLVLTNCIARSLIIPKQECEVLSQFNLV